MSGGEPTLEGMVELVRAGRLDDFVRLAHDLEPVDLGDILAALGDDERLEVVRRLPPSLSGEAMVEMPEEAHAEEMLAALDAETAADIVEEMEDDDAADLLGDMEPADQLRILAAVEDREDVEHLLRYDEESAGGLMTTQMVTVHDSSSSADTLAAVRQQAEEVDDFHQVFVVDDQRRLVGILSFKALVLAAPDRLIREIMEEPEVTVLPTEDQEQVARLMARYNVPAIGVVDPDGRLLGRITFDDVTDVVEEEATEDLLRFGGVSADEELAATWRGAVRSRLPWLFLNLVTAFLAASVVVFFEDTLTQLVSLAIFMPVIAGMGGNTGTQALAVTIRRLALGLIPARQRFQVITKELLVGLTNGIAVAAVAGVVAVVAGLSPQFGLVVFLAMSGNLCVAGFAGAFIPILLSRVGIDPAIASSVFVTTFTDMVGFALLLGLAGLLLL
ncbi:MAG: magnesium transporter [Gemmatimonadota bacterium]|nr:magnesium transporter [Gemmatimonadota bacterium]